MIASLRVRGNAEAEKAAAAQEAMQIKQAQLHTSRADACFLAARRWEAVFADMEAHAPDPTRTPQPARMAW